MSRNYHNLISRYNIYFNGKESYKKGMRKINRLFEDDFTSILPVFKYADENVARSITPEMDRAIAKASKVITLHSITAKPDFKKKELSEREEEFYSRSEYNNWVDDCYLLMGKAQFHKHDFFLALKTLKYTNGMALDDDVRYESLIWIARIYNEEGNFDQSHEILVSLEEDPYFPKNLTSEFYTTLADFYLKQERYNEAIPILEKLLDLKNGKKKSYRYTYILAQTFEETNNEKEAYKLYAKIVKMNPPYEMTFNARINQAESFDVTRENVSEIKKILRRMLRDEKNRDYLDQIYYAYGNIALKETKREEAIEYFKKSATVSVSNNKQKGISYLSIADLYFVQDKYSLAQPYYDSAMMVLDQSYPGYEIINVKTKSLNRLIENINIVEREDSLQKIASMDPVDRLALIDQIIQQVREEEEKLLESQIRGQYNPTSEYESKRRINQELNRSGNWYFYNPAVVGFGRNEFRQKWGDRELEDNWRRNNKSVSELNLAEIVQGEEGYTGKENKIETANIHSRDYYLKDLPINDSLVLLSDQRIENALYVAGQIYLDELKDNNKAQETFEILINRFPGTNYLLTVYYYLYHMNQESENESRASYYKNQIITNYPESEFAKILSDPDYLRKRNEKDREVYRVYEEIYVSYLDGQYTFVIRQCEEALEKYPDHDLESKFRLLRAFAIGKSGNVREFKQALQQVVANSPDSDEKSRATELIAHYNATIPELKAEDEEKESVQIYTLALTEPHIAVLAIEDQSFDLNQLIFSIINFNLDHFSQAEFTTEKQELDEQNWLVTIKGVGNAKDTEDYLEQITSDEAISQELNGKSYFPFVISNSNLGVLLEHKSLSVYLRFYKKYYIESEYPAFQ